MIDCNFMYWFGGILFLLLAGLTLFAVYCRYFDEEKNLLNTIKISVYVLIGLGYAVLGWYLLSQLT